MIDGRTLADGGQVGLAICPLNMRDKFLTQMISSVFYIGLFKCGETKDNVRENIKELKEMIAKIERENGIDVGSTYRLQIHFIYVSDLKNIYSIFDNVNCCPLCTCKTDEVWRFDCKN